MERLIIEVPSGTYPVVIGSNLNRELRGVIGRLDPTTAAIVTDRNVLPWAKKVARAAKRAGVRTPIHVVPPGERSKSMAALGDVLGFLERHKVDRSGVVIAVGGGTPVDESNWRLISERAITVYLEVPFETIWKRTGGGTNRPLSTTRSRAEFEALLDERRPRYEQASHRVDADRPLGVVTDEVLKIWNA